MSFDPISGIWAANKAAEIVGASGGSSSIGSVATIDLTNYGATFDDGVTITGEARERFLNDLNTAIANKQHILLTAFSNTLGARATVSPQVYTLHEDGTFYTLSLEFFMGLESSSERVSSVIVDSQNHGVVSIIIYINPVEHT